MGVRYVQPLLFFEHTNIEVFSPVGLHHLCSYLFGSHHALYQSSSQQHGRCHPSSNYLIQAPRERLSRKIKNVNSSLSWPHTQRSTDIPGLHYRALGGQNQDFADNPGLVCHNVGSLRMY